jgi:ribosome-binding factor A
MSIRTARVAEEIQKVLGERLIRGLRDPLPGFVTIRGVEVTSDFTQAKVFVSVFGSDAQKQGAIAGLQQQRGALRHEIGQKIRLRNTPNLTFVLDESSERAARVHALLDEVKAHDAQLAKQQAAPKPVEPSKPVEAPKPVVEASTPAEASKPVAAPKPIEATKPVETDLTPALPRAPLSSSVERGAVVSPTSTPAPSEPKAAVKKTATTKKAPAKKSAVKEAAKKAPAKKAARKTATKKSAAKTTTAKTPAKKAATKKVATKKVATKATTKKAPVKKKTTTKKAPAKAAKKSAAKTPATKKKG